MIKIFDIFTRKTVKVLLLPMLALCLSAANVSAAEEDVFSQADSAASEYYQAKQAYDAAVKARDDYTSDKEGKILLFDTTYQSLRSDVDDAKDRLTDASRNAAKYTKSAVNQIMNNSVTPEALSKAETYLDVANDLYTGSSRSEYVSMQDAYGKKKTALTIYQKKQQLKNLPSDSEEAQKLTAEINELTNDLDTQALALQNALEAQIEERNDTLDPLKKQEQLDRINSTNTGVGIAKASKNYDPCSDSCAPGCYYSEIKDCTFCDLFRVAFNACSKIANHAIETFSGPLFQLVIVGFALWLAVLTLNFVSSIETRDFKDFASSVITQGFYVLIALILLKTGAMSFFNLALEPVFNTGQNIAQATISPENVATSATDEDAKIFCPASGSYGIIDSEEGGALPASMGENIICTMTLIQARAAKVSALGSSTICYSWEKKWFIIPHLGYLLTGVGLWIGGMILIIAVPFLMIDSVVQMAIAAGLLPFAIAAYPFRITQKYASPVWETFLNAMFAFIFVSLVALMLTTAFEQVLTSAFKDNPVTDNYTLDTLLESGTDADLDNMLKHFSWWTTDFLKVCFALILTWTVMAEIKDFAGKFAGSIQNTDFGSRIATMGGSFTKSAATRLAGKSLEGATDATTNAVARTGRGVVHYARRAANSFQMHRIKNRSTSVRDVEGGRIYTDNKGNEVFEGADGTSSIRRVQNVSKRKFLGMTVRSEKQVTSEKNEHFSIQTTKTTKADGSVEYNDRIRLNSDATRRLFNEDGTRNDEVYDALMNSASGEMKEKVQIAAAKEIVHQAMPNLEFDMRDHSYTSLQAVYDDNGNFIGFNETTVDGKQRSIRLTKGENGRMMVSFTEVDKRGRGRMLSTDGLINKKSTFVTEDGTSTGKISDRGLKTSYGLSANYARYNHRGIRNNIDWESSLFDEEQVAQAKQDVYGEKIQMGAGMYEFRTEHQSRP